MVSFVPLLTFFLLMGYGILLFIYRKYWRSIPDFANKDNVKQCTTFISVIVPARNEEKNIKALLESLKEQDYPSHLFEVLIVDDFSTDNTADLVNHFHSTNIKLIALKDYVDAHSINSYKKKAIETAIELSRGELIVTTDADCVVNLKWLSTIASFYKLKKPKMIVMPVSIVHTSSFIQLFQAIDFISLQGITGAAVHKGFHGMCNGANLAYTKEIFYEVGGFKNIDNIASGDDMMLMHKIAVNYKEDIKYLKSENVIVETQAVRNIREFIYQRVRWASKADQYQDKTLLPVLLLVYFLNFLLLLLFVIVIFMPILATFVNALLIMLFIKIVLELYFLIPVATFFKKQSTLWMFPLLQPLHILYTVVIGGWGKFGTYQWKGRKVK